MKSFKIRYYREVEENGEDVVRKYPIIDGARWEPRLRRGVSRLLELEQGVRRLPELCQGVARLLQHEE